ncbi:MAG: hypothetical protein KBD47_01455 [Candidatus Pacebacteria bacterium]|nr:hypothetical protein [Candidatus Paceibacterota bacterium]
MTALEYAKALGIFLGVVIPLGTAVYVGIALLFEIPEWFRSLSLQRLAKKNGLTFLRAKKGWKSGWLSLDASERNFISGKIKDMSIDFNDITLIQMTLGLGYKPSIAKSDDEWSGRTVPGARKKLVSKLNGEIYKRLSLQHLGQMFNEIANGQIMSNAQIMQRFEKSNFAGKLMRNYQTAAFICFPIFSVSFATIAMIYPSLNDMAFSYLILFNLVVNLPIFIWASKHYGKQFNTSEINKVPETTNI